MSRQPVSIEPIGVPSVDTYTVNGEQAGILVGHLVTTSGPTNFEGRHAGLLLSLSQAESLVRQMAAQLGLLVAP